MRKKIRIFSVIGLGLVLGLFSAPAAADAGTACDETPLWVQAPTSMVLQAADLPKLVLVGRRANIYVESTDGSGNTLKMEASQNFVNAKSKIECVTSSASDSSSVDFVAPTLLDLTNSMNVGSSVWKFNLMVDGAKAGIWNQVSRLESQKFNLMTFSAQPDQQVVFSQLSHEQYEMWIRQTTKNLVKTIVVIFDATH
jgi:hypothetical protein